MVGKNTSHSEIKAVSRSKSGTVSVLVATVAGLVTPYSVSADPVNCVIDGIFQTCSDDQSNGVVVRSPIETLTLEDVTRDIAPSDGVVGIDYQSENDATVLSTTGLFSILTTDADAINVGSELGDVYISHSGDITVENGKGIVANAGNGSAVVEGSGTIVSDLTAIYVDPRGGDAAFNWDGDITSVEGSALFVKADNGGASASGTGDISAELDAVVIDARGSSETASFNWDGDVTSTTGNGVLVHAAHGSVSAQGSGDVSTSGYGFLLDTDYIGGNSTLNWTGDISSELSYGANVLTVGGGSTIIGAGAVTAELDGLYAQAIGGNAQINWTGDVESAEGYGIIAQSPTGGTTILGSGNIIAKLDGLSATNLSGQTSTVNWTGDVTSSTGRAVTITSASGATNLVGSGALNGATDGIYLQNLGDQTASVDWDGDINAGNGNGVRVHSATGPSAVSTSGNITASNGGIYAAAGGNSSDNVSVNHIGNVTAGGVGIEAKSTQAAVSVRADGDLDAGSYGIYARSTGSTAVAVTLNGDITSSGFDGIYAESSSGIVAINQIGSINSDGNGIYAKNLGANTVSVTRSGDITSDVDGVYAYSSQGVVSVHMTSGTISAENYGLYARSTGNNTVDVLLAGDVVKSTTAVSASTTNGAVFVDVDGDLTSTADTIIAETTGSGEVGVNQNGDVTSTSGDGIYARSASGYVTVYQNGGALVAAEHGLHLKGTNNLVAEVGTGASVTGGAGFAAVFMDVGYNNRLTNYGTINNADGINAYAIKAEGNNTVVHNYGTISGNVALGPYANGFTNYEGATLETGSIFKMVAADTLLNEGALSIGKVGQLQVTNLTGNIESTANSVLKLDLDMAAETDQIDRIEVSGSANLSGAVKLKYLRISNTPASYTFLTTDTGVTNQTLTLAQNAFIEASLDTINTGKDVQLTIDTLNFAQDDLQGNAKSLAHYFQRALDAGAEGIEDFGAIMVNAGYDSDAKTIYEEISPDIALAAVTTTYDTSLRFADAIMSCSVPSGMNAPIAEGECNWSRMSITTAERSSSVDPGTYQAESVDLAFGAQQAINMSDWRSVYGISFTSGNSQGDAGESTQSSTAQIGGALKYASGPMVISVGLTGSWSSVMSNRELTLGDINQELVGNTDISAYTLKMRGAYLMQQTDFYLKPQIDINVSTVHLGAYTETGGSGAVSFDNQSETAMSLSPSVEFGRDLRKQNGQVTRAFARIGTTISSNDGLGISGRLATDNTNVDMYTIDAGTDRHVMDLALGLTSFSIKNWSTEFLYKGRFADHLEEHSANLKLRVNF